MEKISQRIRISKDILQQANIEVDDVLDIEAVDGMITLMKSFRHKTLEERAAEFNWRNRWWSYFSG